MKGFIRILESIIASIILLTSMTFFLTPGVLKTGWEDANVHIQTRDVLSTIYKNGLLTEYIKFNDVNSLNNELGDLFSRTLDFSVEVKGLPNPEIRIGCNCSDAEITELKNLLSPLDFNYTGRNISIRIRNETITNIRNETDVLFIFDYKDLNPYNSYLDDFLERGGTIFMLADLTEEQINDRYLNETFGLEWSETPGNPSGNGEFYDTIKPERVSYKIAKYFVNISGMPDTTTFQKFNKGGTINHVGIDNRTIIIDVNNKFSFVKINKGMVNGNGRTVWFADYNPHTDIPTNYLLKATIMWASGERYKMDPYAKRYPKTFTKTKYIIFDEDPYEIDLVVWKIFH